MKNLKVIIVDDEPVIRTSLQEWLARDFKVQSYESAGAFLNAFNQFDFEDGLPTCLLLDFQMPEMNGVELQSSLQLMNADFPIIFMSGNAEQADIIDAWRGGANDFILKPFTPSQITDALSIQFSKLTEAKPINPTDQHSSFDIPITKREAEVLLLLGSGKQQIEVAEILGISLRTVKMYRSFLKDKLELNTLGELARYSMKHEKSIQKIADKS